MRRIAAALALGTLAALAGLAAGFGPVLLAAAALFGVSLGWSIAGGTGLSASAEGLRGDDDAGGGGDGGGGGE